MERAGRVRVLEDMRLSEEPALDLTDRVFSVGGWETGMLGIALHPDYDTNGRAFITFTAVEDKALVLAEFIAHVPGGAAFDRQSYRELLRVEQPGHFHQGGTIRFGPEGNLWVGLGDGGSPSDDDPTGVQQDRFGFAQDPATLQGTIVRIDVDAGAPYGVPMDNPFVGGDEGAPEVWAYGLRNPWSFAFDGDLLFVADVGHVGWEEVSVVSWRQDGGTNFGWSVMEGPEPVIALARPDLCAVIGGPVYRGSAIPDAVGEYFYADLCSGWVRSARIEDGVLVGERVRIQATASVAMVTAFLVDDAGEMYLMTYDGEIHRIGLRL